jgi:hypothetical protein
LVIEKEFWDIGADPFIRKYSNSVRPVAYSMDSIIFTLELGERRRNDNYVIGGVMVEEVGWNPFIYDKDGNKHYYQRDFCWNLQQEQLLIESIYKGIQCGNIVVRKRAWKSLEAMAAKGETELTFTDIVDGKQRLNTIKRFYITNFLICTEIIIMTSVHMLNMISEITSYLVMPKWMKMLVMKKYSINSY